MNQQYILDQIQAAKASHIQWRARAQALVAGIPVSQEQIPVLYTECKFGKWFYGPGQMLHRLPSYKAVEEAHEQLHNIYMQIFNTLFGKNHRSFLSSMFSSKRQQDAEKRTEAQKQLEHLIMISRTLLESIELLENEVRMLSEERVA